jgi:hypothetical protein
MFGILLEIGVLLSQVYLDLGRYNNSPPVATNFWLVPFFCLNMIHVSSLWGTKNRNICPVLDIKNLLPKLVLVDFSDISTNSLNGFSIPKMKCTPVC